MKKFTKLFTACIFSCLLFLFSVFPAFAEGLEIDQETLNSYVQSVIEQIASTDAQQYDDVISYYDQNGYPGIAEGFTEWKALSESVGAFNSVENCTITYNEDGTTSMDATVVFENCSLGFNIQLDVTGYLSGFSFTDGSAQQSSTLFKSLKEAGINLVVGMGTVFAVLIFLCWIISLFKHVSVFEKKLADRKKKPSVKTEEPVLAQNRSDTVSVSPAPGSDGELQAVIAAAIAAYEAEEGCAFEKQPALDNGLIIKTYRRN